MVNPINITSAAIITQFSIGAIMVKGVLILSWGNIQFLSWGGFSISSRDDGTDFSKLAWVIVAFILLTLGCLAFSDEFSKLWRPLFGSVYFPLLRWSAALAIVYTLNVVCVAILVLLTGGNRASPFNPLYTTILTLAIFLREPLGRILYYLILTTVFFTFTFGSKKIEEPDNSKFSFWVVFIFSLILAVFIGYITRPT